MFLGQSFSFTPLCVHCGVFQMNTHGRHTHERVRRAEHPVAFCIIAAITHDDVWFPKAFVTAVKKR